VVGRHHQLEPVRAARRARGGQSGIVDQHVDPVIAPVELGGRAAHRGEVAEVGKDHLGRGRSGRAGGELGGHGVGLGLVASHDGDRGTPLCESTGDFLADATGGSGDDNAKVSDVPLCRSAHLGLLPAS
jgi:hypothetical protein